MTHISEQLKPVSAILFWRSHQTDRCIAKGPLLGTLPGVSEPLQALGPVYESLTHPSVTAFIAPSTEEVEPGVAESFTKEIGKPLLMAGYVTESSLGLMVARNLILFQDPIPRVNLEGGPSVRSLKQ